MKLLPLLLLLVGMPSFGAAVSEKDILAIESASASAFVGGDCGRVGEIRATIKKTPNLNQPTFIVENSYRCEGDPTNWKTDETCAVLRQDDGTWAADYCDH